MALALSYSESIKFYLSLLWALALHQCYHPPPSPVCFLLCRGCDALFSEVFAGWLLFFVSLSAPATSLQQAPRNWELQGTRNSTRGRRTCGQRWQRHKKNSLPGLSSG